MENRGALTKARLKYERAGREFRHREDLAWAARREWERLGLEYMKIAEEDYGLCRICFQPKNVGDHATVGHLLFAAMAVFE